MKTFDYPLIPMEPLSSEQSFDSPDYLFQIKWDGVRCLAYAMDGKTQLFNRKKNGRSEQYPELIEALSYLPQGTVLDGEIVALNERGLPDFPRVLRRDLAKNKSTIHAAKKRVTVQYIVFDMPYLHGEDLTGQPLAARMDLLREVVANEYPIARIESVKQNGSALFNAVKDMGMEGIVAKRKLSRYLIGQKTPHWLKIKAWRDMEATILGYEEAEGLPRSLILGLEEDGVWRYIGNASSGLTEITRKTLRQQTTPQNPPHETAGPLSSSIRWVAADHKAKIRYLEWSPDGKLRNPSILSIFQAGDTP